MRWWERERVLKKGSDLDFVANELSVPLSSSAYRMRGEEVHSVMHLPPLKDGCSRALPRYIDVTTVCEDEILHTRTQTRIRTCNIREELDKAYLE